MNASVFRDTRFELAAVLQEANGFTVHAVERGIVETAPPPLLIHEDAFTDEEMAQIHAVLELLERKFADVHDANLTTPAAAHTAMRRRLEAEQALEAAKAEHAKLEEELAAKRAEMAKLAEAAPPPAEEPTP